jgi:hypothetical protein
MVSDAAVVMLVFAVMFMPKLETLVALALTLTTMSIVLSDVLGTINAELKFNMVKLLVTVEFVANYHFSW